MNEDGENKEDKDIQDQDFFNHLNKTVMKLEREGVSCVEVSGSLFWAGLTNGKILVFSLVNGEKMREIQHCSGQVWSLGLSGEKMW